MIPKIRIGLLSLLMVFLSVGYVYGFDFHGKTSNTIYSYDDSTQHTRLFQFIRFNLDVPKLSNLSLNTSLRALTNLDETLEDDQRFKAYALNLHYKNLFNRVDLILGRQFLHPGAVLGGLDGLYTKVRISNRMNISAYAGTEAHFNSSLKIYKSEDSFVAGGLFEMNRYFSTTTQLFYMQKSNADGLFWQLAGLNLTNASLPRTNVRLQAHLDLQTSAFHRLLFSAKHDVTDKISVNAGFKNQMPQIYANSFFTIFDVDGYTQFNAGCTYNLAQKLFLSGQYQLVQFDQESANRVFFTVNNLNGSIGVVYETGYAGEQLGLILDYAHAITPALLASINIDYSRYKTEKVFEFENQIANAVRLSYRFQRHWSIDLEYQWLTNRFKEQDSRILNHIHFSW